MATPWVRPGSPKALVQARGIISPHSQQSLGVEGSRQLLAAGEKTGQGTEGRGKREGQGEREEKTEKTWGKNLSGRSFLEQSCSGIGSKLKLRQHHLEGSVKTQMAGITPSF